MKKLILGLMMAFAANAVMAEVAPETDFEFSNGTIAGYKGPGGNVEIPPTINGVPVTSIGESAFWVGRDKITSVTIPEGVTSIGRIAFNGCGSLGSVAIPASVTDIGETAFGTCYKLKNVTIPYGVTSVSSALFSYCTSLERVTIPESVTSVGDSVFGACEALTNVRIPAAVTNIGCLAFLACSKLTRVVVLADNPPSVGEGAFVGVGDGCVIYVPRDSVDKYKAAEA